MISKKDRKSKLAQGGCRFHGSGLSEFVAQLELSITNVPVCMNVPSSRSSAKTDRDLTTQLKTLTDVTENITYLNQFAQIERQTQKERQTSACSIWK